MAISIRPFQSGDLQCLDQWATRININDFMSRSRPKSLAIVAHNPSAGLYWYIIVDSDREIGTVWIEPGDQPDTSVLGIFLGDQSVFGRGIGSQAIRYAIIQFRAAFPGRAITLNVRQSNHRAIACYKKVGFSVVAGSVKVFGNGDSIPIFQMRLSLNT
jgi:RimJ/RimL family protein N-acetyltransferase